MQKSIISQVIGEISRDKTFPDWWNSAPVAIPFFDGRQMVITFTELEPDDDEIFVAEADEALQHFLALGYTDRNSVSHLLKQHGDSVLQASEQDGKRQEMTDLKDENEIWESVHPTEIYVSRRKNRDEDIYIQVTCECDWSPEHGLQLVFRQGRKLTRISTQDGHLTEADAYGKPDKEDLLLSQF
jgi:hypothetical protein